MSSVLRPHRRGPDPDPDRPGSDSGGTVVATVSALTAHRALATLVDAGFDRDVLVRQAGLTLQDPPDFRQRVPIDAVERLFERGIALLGPDFPLLARSSRPEDNHSPVVMYCRTRQTAGEAVRALCDLYGLVTDGHALRLDEEPSGVWLTWCGRPRPALWWFEAADVYANLSSLLPRGTRSALGAFRAPFPAPPGARSLFGVEPEPHATFSARLAPWLLSVPFSPVDPAVRAHIEREVRELAAVAPSTVPAIVAALWSLGPTATLSKLAELLGVSERTVHRRFGEAGTSFRAELDAMRVAIARDAPGRSMEELAELLGYSDARTLRRAIRRWETE